MSATSPQPLGALGARFLDPARAVTAYGLAVEVRPLTPADRDAFAALIDGLGDRSRFQRFLGGTPGLTSRELDQLTAVDHRTHEALVAVDPSDGRIVAEARYAAWPAHPGSADIAFVVADLWQGQGIGTLLAGEAVRRADANGITRLTASTFTDNAPARAVLRKLGFRTVGFGGGVVDLVREGA